MAGRHTSRIWAGHIGSTVRTVALGSMEEWLAPMEEQELRPVLRPGTGGCMTIKELYEEAQKLGREDWDIVVYDPDNPGYAIRASKIWFDEDCHEVYLE